MAKRTSRQNRLRTSYLVEGPRKAKKSHAQIRREVDDVLRSGSRQLAIYRISARDGEGPTLETTFAEASVRAQQVADEYGEDVWLSLAGVPYTQKTEERFSPRVDGKIATLGARASREQRWLLAPLCDRALNRGRATNERLLSRLSPAERAAVLGTTLLEARRRCIAEIR